MTASEAVMPDSGPSTYPRRRASTTAARRMWILLILAVGIGVPDRTHADPFRDAWIVPDDVRVYVACADGRRMRDHLDASPIDPLLRSWLETSRLGSWWTQMSERTDLGPADLFALLLDRGFTLVTTDRVPKPGPPRRDEDAESPAWLLIVPADEKTARALIHRCEAEAIGTRAGRTIYSAWDGEIRLGFDGHRLYLADRPAGPLLETVIGGTAARPLSRTTAFVEASRRLEQTRPLRRDVVYFAADPANRGDDAWRLVAVEIGTDRIDLVDLEGLGPAATVLPQAPPPSVEAADLVGDEHEIWMAVTGRYVPADAFAALGGNTVMGWQTLIQKFFLGSDRDGNDDPDRFGPTVWFLMTLPRAHPEDDDDGGPRWPATAWGIELARPDEAVAELDRRMNGLGRMLRHGAAMSGAPFDWPTSWSEQPRQLHVGRFPAMPMPWLAEEADAPREALLAWQVVDHASDPGRAWWVVGSNVDLVRAIADRLPEASPPAEADDEDVYARGRMDGRVMARGFDSWPLASAPEADTADASGTPGARMGGLLRGLRTWARRLDAVAWSTRRLDEHVLATRTGVTWRAPTPAQASDPAPAAKP